MDKETKFKVVTKEFLEQSNLKYYGGGRELKEDDLIIGGYTMYYCKMGLPPTSFRSENCSLVLNLFVWCDKTNMIYQLYEAKDIENK
jgi:hypothetical protein